MTGRDGGDRLYDVVALIAWSHDQLDADERIAARAGAHHPVWTYDRETFTVSSGGGYSIAARKADGSPINDVDGEHISRQDPAQTLADVAAHRVILDRLTTWVEEERAARDDYSAWAAGDRSPAGLPQRTVPYQEGPGLEYAARALAVRFAGRPGYRAEWKP